MKKYFLVIFTIIISLFMFCNRVEADDKVMYLECAYGDESYVFAYIQANSANNDFNSDYRMFNKKNLGEYKEHCDTNSYAAGCQAGIANSSGGPILYWVKDANKYEECKKNCKKIDGLYLYNRTEIAENLSKGICPEKISPGYLGGTTTTSVTKSVLKSNFVIYRSGTSDYFEGYTGDGHYIALRKDDNSKNVQRIDSAETSKTQHNALALSRGEYFNLNKEENRYKTGSVVKTYISSDNIGKHIDNWISQGYGTALTNQIQTSTELLNNNSKILNACSNLNKTKEINFNTYSPSNMINDLERAYNLLSDFYSNSNGYKRCSISGSTSNYLESLFDCTLYNNLGYSNIEGNGGEYINTIILNNFKDELHKHYPNIGKTEEIDEFLDTLYRCSINLDSSVINLSQEDKKKIEKLRNNFEDLAIRQNITVIEDCKSLIGIDLIKKVRSYTNIIKIAIPILLIMFGIYDFCIAIFSGDDDKMNKTKKQFLTRILIAVLIYLTPIFVNLILNIANSVWKFISPDSCGLF